MCWRDLFPCHVDTLFTVDKVWNDRHLVTRDNGSVSCTHHENLLVISGTVDEPGGQYVEVNKLCAKWQTMPVPTLRLYFLATLNPFSALDPTSGNHSLLCFLWEQILQNLHRVKHERYVWFLYHMVQSLKHTKMYVELIKRIVWMSLLQRNACAKYCHLVVSNACMYQNHTIFQNMYKFMCRYKKRFLKYWYIAISHSSTLFLVA